MQKQRGNQYLPELEGKCRVMLRSWMVYMGQKLGNRAGDAGLVDHGVYLNYTSREAQSLGMVAACAEARFYKATVVSSQGIDS